MFVVLIGDFKGNLKSLFSALGSMEDTPQTPLVDERVILPVASIASSRYAMYHSAVYIPATFESLSFSAMLSNILIRTFNTSNRISDIMI